MYQYPFPTKCLWMASARSGLNFNSAGDYTFRNMFGRPIGDGRSGFWYPTHIISFNLQNNGTGTLTCGIWDGAGATGNNISPAQTWGSGTSFLATGHIFLPFINQTNFPAAPTAAGVQGLWLSSTPILNVVNSGSPAGWGTGEVVIFGWDVSAAY